MPEVSAIGTRCGFNLCAVLYTAPYIPAGIQSFLRNPAESSGMRLESTRSLHLATNSNRNPIGVRWVRLDSDQTHPDSYLADNTAIFFFQSNQSPIGVWLNLLRLLGFWSDWATRTQIRVWSESEQSKLLLQLYIKINKSVNSKDWTCSLLRWLKQC